MKRIIVTEHDDCFIAYGHMYPINESLIEYMKHIYLEYYDTELSKPMYLFLGRHTFLLYPKKVETFFPEHEPPSDIVHAGIFARYEFPRELSGNYNVHKFTFDDEMLVHEQDNTIGKPFNEKQIDQLLISIKLYSSDLYRVFVPFDVIYCNGDTV